MEEENIVVVETTEDANDIVEEVAEESETTEEEKGEIVEEIELNDTSIEENEQKKSLKELLKENPKFQEEFNEMFSKRFSREKRKMESNYNPLINTLKAGGYESDNPIEIAERIKESYEAQGISIPSYDSGLSEREQKALAKVDADEVIELGEDVMRERFTELYNKPNRSKREEEEMYLIGRENSIRLAKRDLLEIGADPDKVLNDSKFKEFASKMAANVPIKDIYQLYTKVNVGQTQKIPSAGSVKNNNNSGEKFTQSKLDNMTPQELEKYWDDPEFRKIAGLN